MALIANGTTINTLNANGTTMTNCLANSTEVLPQQKVFEFTFDDIFYDLNSQYLYISGTDDKTYFQTPTNPTRAQWGMYASGSNVAVNCYILSQPHLKYPSFPAVIPAGTKYDFYFSHIASNSGSTSNRILTCDGASIYSIRNGYSYSNWSVSRTTLSTIDTTYGNYRKLLRMSTGASANTLNYANIYKEYGTGNFTTLTITLP